jgi:archaellin
MNNKGNMGISTISVLVSFLIAGATTSSVVLKNSDNISGDVGQIVNDALDKITTYIEIKDAIGKYDVTNGIRSVEKIVLLVKPLVSTNINMSEVMIKISNDNDVLLLSYSGYAVERSSAETIFENQVWDKTDNAFGLIVLIDKDNSLLTYGVMNDDTAFIAIKLPSGFAMTNDESLMISIIPARGTTTSVVLETPSFHTANIISFAEI